MKLILQFQKLINNDITDNENACLWKLLQPNKWTE